MKSDGTSSSFITTHDGMQLAYHKTPGKNPGVIFCGGFMSDMTGTKALALEEYCRKKNHAFVRFDYRGHGQSSGDFADATISDWREDALTVLDNLTDGPQIIIGSSMGAWIALLLAIARPEKIVALLGIAAAPDFTEELIWQTLSPQYQEKLLREKVLYKPSDYNANPYPITLQLIEEGRKHLLLQQKIPFHGPVRLLHGMNDTDVPWETSCRVMQKLQTKDVQLRLIKEGDHRLAREQDLLVLTQTLDELLCNPINYSFQ